MNERIQELIKEATISRVITGPEVFTTPPIYFDKEKFAELLISECMDIISDESEKVSDEWRCNDGKHIWWKIKEHFGVE